MASLVVYVLVAVITLLLLYYFKYSSRSSDTKGLRSLPGPKGWPILGNVLEFQGKTMHETLRQWAVEYGPVFRFRFFWLDVVIINSLKGIQEAFLDKGYDFAGRQRFQDFLLTRPPGRGLATQDPCPLWKTMRKIVHRSLTMTANGHKNFENNMNFVLDELVESLRKEADADVDFYNHIHHTLAAFICSLITGRHCKRSERMVTLIREFDVIPRLAASKGAFLLLNALPWLRHFERDTMKIIQEGRQKSDIFWNEFMLPLKDSQEFKEGKGLYADMKKMVDEVRAMDGTNEQLLNDNDVRALIDTMFQAGIVTTTASLYSLFNILVHNPRVQARIVDEITSNVGTDGERVKLEHKDELPYTRAVVLELLRFTSVAPIAAPHVTIRDTGVLGYDIPKGTTVMMNLWHLHHDESEWAKPWDFNPDRFLTQSGELVPPDHPLRRRVLAFGIGARACTGEAIALNRLFMFTATLVQHFQFLPPDDTSELSSCDPRDYPPASVIQPTFFKMKLVPRFTSKKTATSCEKFDCNENCV